MPILIEGKSARALNTVCARADEGRDKSARGAVVFQDAKIGGGGDCFSRVRPIEAVNVQVPVGAKYQLPGPEEATALRGNEVRSRLPVRGQCAARVGPGGTFKAIDGLS